jgi:hypothetical protein
MACAVDIEIQSGQMRYVNMVDYVTRSSWRKPDVKYKFWTADDDWCRGWHGSSLMRAKEQE